MACGHTHLVYRGGRTGPNQRFFFQYRGEVAAQQRKLGVGERLARGDFEARKLDLSGGVEAGGLQARAKLGHHHGLEPGSVAQLRHERLQCCGRRVDALDFDALELLRHPRGRFDGRFVEINLREREVRVCFEQLLALATGVRLEQRRQRPLPDELPDSFADARGADYRRDVRAVDALGKFRALCKAVSRRVQGFQRDFCLLAARVRAFAAHAQRKAGAENHPVRRIVVSVGERKRRSDSQAAVAGFPGLCRQPRARRVEAGRRELPFLFGVLFHVFLTTALPANSC